MEWATAGVTKYLVVFSHPGKNRRGGLAGRKLTKTKTLHAARTLEVVYPREMTVQIKKSACRHGEMKRKFVSAWFWIG